MWTEYISQHLIKIDYFICVVFHLLLIWHELGSLSVGTDRACSKVRIGFRPFTKLASAGPCRTHGTKFSVGQ